MWEEETQVDPIKRRKVQVTLPVGEELTILRLCGRGLEYLETFVESVSGLCKVTLYCTPRSTQTESVV